jgi:Domain of unknown function (DUF4340)
LSPRHAILFSILIALAAPYYHFVDRPRPRIAAPSVERMRLLKVSEIDAVTITAGGQTVRFEKAPDGRSYKLVEPPNKFVPQDLMKAMVSLLIDAKSVEVVSTDPGDLAEFGLDRPRAEIAVRARSSRMPIVILLGADNPTGTAIYARIKGAPEVFMLGSDLDYYRTLMFEWIEGKQGKNA